LKKISAIYTVAAVAALISLAGLVLVLRAGSQSSVSTATMPVVCFYLAEHPSAANDKVCYYSCGGRQSTLRIKSPELCPTATAIENVTSELEVED
jgi:hypothetical protein